MRLMDYAVELRVILLFLRSPFISLPPPRPFAGSPGTATTTLICAVGGIRLVNLASSFFIIIILFFVFCFFPS